MQALTEITKAKVTEGGRAGIAEVKHSNKISLVFTSRFEQIRILVVVGVLRQSNHWKHRMNWTTKNRHTWCCRLCVMSSTYRAAQYEKEILLAPICTVKGKVLSEGNSAWVRARHGCKRWSNSKGMALPVSRTADSWIASAGTCSWERRDGRPQDCSQGTWL